MASGVKKDRWADKLKDINKREHQKEARKACPLGCFGESAKNDSLTLTDSTPPFKNNRLFALKQIETINRANKIPEQCIKDRGQVALWLLIHGKLNPLQVLFFTQLEPVKYVNAYHTNNETCSPITKGWLLRKHLEYVQHETILPLEFIERFKSKKYRECVVNFLHKIGFAYISLSSLAAFYSRYAEEYKESDEPKQKLVYPYEQRQQKLEEQKRRKAQRSLKDIANMLPARKKKNNSSNAKENVILKIDSSDEKITKSAKKQETVTNFNVEYKNTSFSPKTLRMPKKNKICYGIKAWRNENANDNVIIKNRNYSLSI